MSDSNDDVYKVASELDVPVEVFEMDKLDDILNLDLDGGAQINQDVMKVLRDTGVVERFGERMLVTMSKGGQGTHVYIQMNVNMDLPMRSALQAALGSDPKREALSMVRAKFLSRNPAQVLFELVPEAQSVKAWLGPKRLPKAQPPEAPGTEPERENLAGSDVSAAGLCEACGGYHDI